MLLVSDMFGLKYWMYRDLIIDVEDLENGGTAKVLVRSVQFLESNLTREMMNRVKNDLNTFKNPYIEYWKEAGSDH